MSTNQQFPGGPWQQPQSTSTPQSPVQPHHVVGPTTPRRHRRALLGIPAVALIAALASSGLTAAVINAQPAPAAVTTTTTTQVVTDADWTAIAALVQPSVVSITVTSGQSEAMGSGVVWSADGVIITNHHVVEGVGHRAGIRCGDRPGRAAPGPGA